MTVKDAKQELENLMYENIKLSGMEQHLSQLDNMIKIADKYNLDAEEIKYTYNKYKDIIAETCRKRLTTINAINQLDNLHGKVLLLFHLNGCKLPEVAEAIDRNYTYTSKLHTEALKMYAEIRSRSEQSDVYEQERTLPAGFACKLLSDGKTLYMHCLPGQHVCCAPGKFIGSPPEYGG